MKVICIDASNQPVEPYVVEGVVYNTEGVEQRKSGLCYRLTDWLPEMMCWALTSRFIPLSNIDEKEFERNYNTQTA